MPVGAEKLEAAISYQFSDRGLLHRALTHSSHVHENARESADNEQLEFLGDSVLGFVVSEFLVSRFPSFSEGRLSKMRAHLVSAANLYGIARGLDLGDYLLLGRGEELSGGRSKKTLLVDALEAVIAAIYQDGGIDPARTFVRTFVCDPAIAASDSGEDGARPVVDYKSALQELAQARKLPAPRYAIVKELGPEHAKTFTVEVRVGREWTGKAEGLSKKSAAQNAARDVLSRISEHPGPG